MLAFRVNRDITLQILGLEHAYPLYHCVMQNRAHLQPWFNWVSELSGLEDMEAFILESWDQAKEGLEFHFGIWWRDRLIGVIGAHSIDAWTRSGEIGYWLEQRAEGKGIMTHVTTTVLRFLFMEQQLNRLEIRCAHSNRRSQAIPRRLGFRLVGFFREAERVADQLEDMLIYELLRREWEALHFTR
jgi:ribosomal-protein-serine acetyltransferase